MGRITVFTVDDDIHSKRVCEALQQNGLPFSNISLSTNPQRLTDLDALTNRVSCPQVFFNTYHLSSADECIETLERWDTPCRQYHSLMARFQAQVLSQPEPQNARLALPPRRHSSTEKHNDPQTDSPNDKRTSRVLQINDLLHNTIKAGSFLDIIEKLKNESKLVQDQIKFRGVLYKLCFTGDSAIRYFTEIVGNDSAAASSLAQQLLDCNILVPALSALVVESNKNPKRRSASSTKGISAHALYRLSCHATPHILNSYCVWNQPSSRSADEVLIDLEAMLNKMELDCMTKRGGHVNHDLVRKHALFPQLEHAACELQRIDFVSNNMALALNLYHAMRRYANIKLGICQTESNRLSMMNQVKFNLGGYLFSFQEWVECIICGSLKRKKAGASLAKNDPRQRFVVSGSEFECLVHFALNVGSWMGSRTSLPFARYSMGKLREQLVIAARIFCEDDVVVSLVAKNRVDMQVSKAVEAFQEDFQPSLLAVIREYLPCNKKICLKKVVNHRKQVTITFVHRDAASNSCDYRSFNENDLKTQFRGIQSLFRNYIHNNNKRVSERCKRHELVFEGTAQRVVGW